MEKGVLLNYSCKNPAKSTIKNPAKFTRKKKILPNPTFPIPPMEPNHTAAYAPEEAARKGAVSGTL